MLRHCGWVLVCLSSCAFEVEGHEAAFEVVELPPRPTMPYYEAKWVTAGDWHSCMVTKCGYVRCWGRNAERQLDPPRLPAGLTYVEVEAGHEHTCARRSDGSMVCWGDDTYGQVSGTPSGTDLVTFDVTGDHACAVRADQTVVCWGRDTNGQTTVPGSLMPSNLVAVGREFSAAALDRGTYVSTWGDNGRGQLNPLDNVYFWYGRPQQLALGGEHGCLIASNRVGRLVCWGDNSYGQISPTGSALAQLNSLPATEDPGAYVFQPFGREGMDPHPRDWDFVATGEFHTCGISNELQHEEGTESNAFCWGDGNARKTAVPLGYVFTRISAGYEHTCGLATPVKPEGSRLRVVCWGENLQGQTSVPEQPAPELSCGVGTVRRDL
jgi:hypothetical protein